MVRHGVFAAGPEGREVPIPRLLFAFVGAPVLWINHLLVSYFVITMGCITTWDGAGWAMAVVTALFALGALAAGWTARRLWRRLEEAPPPPHNLEPDARDWTRMMLVAGMAASVLFTVVIVMEGAAPLFVPMCR